MKSYGKFSKTVLAESFNLLGKKFRSDLEEFRVEVRESKCRCLTAMRPVA
jgi:hypothetical protein